MMSVDELMHARIKLTRSFYLTRQLLKLILRARSILDHQPLFARFYNISNSHTIKNEENPFNQKREKNKNSEKAKRDSEDNFWQNFKMSKTENLNCLKVHVFVHLYIGI